MPHVARTGASWSNTAPAKARDSGHALRHIPQKLSTSDVDHSKGCMLVTASMPVMIFFLERLGGAAPPDDLNLSHRRLFLLRAHLMAPIAPTCSTAS
jgi:hypothetical protein